MKKGVIISAIVLVCLLSLVAVPLVTIQLRLSRNQPVAQSLAEDLSVRYPAYRFTGSASYEQDVIYIQAHGVADKAARTEIHDWLAAEKARRHIEARLLLMLDVPKAEAEEFEL